MENRIGRIEECKAGRWPSKPTLRLLSWSESLEAKEFNKGLLGSCTQLSWHFELGFTVFYGISIARDLLSRSLSVRLIPTYRLDKDIRTYAATGGHDGRQGILPCQE